jgi:hypothetical protein
MSTGGRGQIDANSVQTGAPPPGIVDREGGGKTPHPGGGYRRRDVAKGGSSP